MFRRLLVIAVTCMAFLAIAATAFAGGAATSIDEAPDEFQAGVSHDITYTVLQHGVTPIEGETALLFSQDGSEPLRFVGTPTDTPGQYVATVELPEAGSWLIEVDQAAFGVVEYNIIDAVDSWAFPISGEALAIVAVAAVAGLLVFALRSTRQASSPNSSPASPITSET